MNTSSRPHAGLVRPAPAAPLAPGLALQADASSDRDLLVADDGRHLAASWFEPAGAARAVAVVNAAAAVPRGYYRHFAAWLAARGYAVLTYDYRGIGGSARGAPRDERATMRDWAVLDMSAALAAAQARRRAGRLPLLLVGHSFGGNCIGFAAGAERADAILTVGSQVGEVRYYDGVHRLVTYGFYAALPLVTALFGQVPGWALGGSGTPMPSEVARQWSRWGRQRGWAFADPAMKPHAGHGGLGMPIHLWGISDDLQYAPPRAVDALAATFRNAAVQRHEVRPADVGARAIGHFGPFRREPGERLWRRLLAPIEQAAPALRAAGLAPIG